MIFNVNENEVKKASGKQVHIASALESPALIDIYGETTQDGTPTPDAPVDIESSVISEIKVYRKNIAVSDGSSFTNYNDSGLSGVKNADGTFTLSGTATKAQSFRIASVSLKANITFTLSGCPSGGGQGKYYLYLGSESTKKDFGNGVTFSFTEDKEDSLYFIVSKGVSVDGLTLKPMVSIEGGEYEPYSETVYTLPEPITLNGLNGVSDYISVKRGKLVQKFYKKVFTEEDEITQISNNRFQILLSQIAGDGYTKIMSLSSHFESMTHLNIASTDKTNVFAVNAEYVYFRVDSGTTIEQFKAILSEGVTVVYELAESIETPLSEANLRVLREIITYAGVNNISNDANALMSVTYASTVGAGMTLEHNKALNGLKLVPMSESDYEALTEKDNNTLYLVY